MFFEEEKKEDLFGINPEKNGVSPLFGAKLDNTSLFFPLQQLNTEVYTSLPKTECINCPGCSKVEAACCKIGGPKLRHIEFLNVYAYLEGNKDLGFKGWSPFERLQLLIDCVRYQIQDDTEDPIKPCLFLTENNLCSIYPVRWFQCRIYGQSPEGTWDDLVEDAVEERSKVDDTEWLPMKNQCQNIEIKENKKLNEDVVNALRHNIKKLESQIGIYDAIIKSGETYLHFHEHLIIFLLGPDIMSQLSDLRGFSQKDKDHFMKSYIEAWENKFELSLLRDGEKFKIF